MESDAPRKKVDAIYRLREAVETKAEAEHEFSAGESPAARDALLEAQLDVEAKTQDAIEACHECGHEAGDGHSHRSNAKVASRDGNVVHVDFRPAADSA